MKQKTLPIQVSEELHEKIFRMVKDKSTQKGYSIPAQAIVGEGIELLEKKAK